MSEALQAIVLHAAERPSCKAPGFRPCGICCLHLSGPRGIIDPVVMTYRQRLILAAYYAGEITGGKAAELLGLSGKAAFMDWLLERGLIYVIDASEDELVRLRAELWSEGMPADEIDRLTGATPPPKPVVDIVESVDPADLLLFLSDLDGSAIRSD